MIIRAVNSMNVRCNSLVTKCVMNLKHYNLNFVCLKQYALCSISDSVTISGESVVMMFLAVIIREDIECPEVLYTGSIIMTGLDADIIRSAIAMNKHNVLAQLMVSDGYVVSNIRHKVAELMFWCAKLSSKWWWINDV